MGELQLPHTKKLALRVVVDNTSTDVFFGEHGLYYTPAMPKPTSDKSLSIDIRGAKATFTRLRVRELKSIWKESKKD